MVETTAHSGARPTHAEWQGQIFSRSGKSRKYPDFVQVTGYGTGEGLGGWNCSHSFSPYFEGMPRTYTPEMQESYQAKDYEYNGEKMTLYEAQQKQREIERNLRRWKRENLAMKAAGQDTTQSAGKIAEWQERQKDFLSQTGLRRQSDREQVAGWDRSEAAEASATARKAAIPQLKNAAGQSIIKVEHTKTTSAPNSITQRESKKGGIDRNYYGQDGRQVRQISNNGHGHKKEEAMGVHGEHAHDYFWDADGNMTRGEARELTDQERRDNSDILQS